MIVAKAGGLEMNERLRTDYIGMPHGDPRPGKWKSHSEKSSAISPNRVTVGVPSKVFLLVAAVLVAAASFLTGCMHPWSVCVPTSQGKECMAGYTKRQAHREWKTLYFFTDPEVVKTPKGIGKKANDLQLPNDSGKQTGKPI